MNGLTAALDNGLLRAGEDIKLRRSVGTTNKANVDVDIRAAVVLEEEKVLVGGTVQSQFLCTFSPTEINRAQWPGGQLPGGTEDPRIPSKNRGDEGYVQGRWRAVQWARGFYPGGELCRIEMRVKG